jgi:hypothetical protein
MFTFGKKLSPSEIMQSLTANHSCFISLEKLKSDENIIKYSDEEERKKMIDRMTSVMVENKLKELNLTEDKILPQ